MPTFISLGAGVQSSAMALMAACGDLTPMPDAAIFADTQDEPEAVYQHLAWLTSVLPFPVHTVTAGKLSKRYLEGCNEARMPFYIRAGGIGKRQCTRNFKIRPIRRKYRELAGYSPTGPIPKHFITQWIGISYDELWRMKPSGVNFILNVWPLVVRRMTRTDCEDFLWAKFRRRAPKSACKQCPYQGPERLVQLKAVEPAAFEELCRFDESLRTPQEIARVRGEVYLLPSLVPLRDADLNLLANVNQLNLFNNECEGMCGV